MDALLSCGALVVLSGPMFAIGLVVRCTSPGNAVYRARRVGHNGVEFRMYKFRSMYAGADQHGRLITGASDPRVTPFGRWLRQTKLDELPALWNVLKGEMSLVGPRPENPTSVLAYTPEQRRVLSIRPGLTSLASIKYRHEEDLLDGDVDSLYVPIMQDKLRLDLAYIDTASLGRDLRILTQTLRAILHAQQPHP
jgi:lipopolysaccharide/colanic/teichoic acid biosynthesis glycosyltransferase